MCAVFGHTPRIDGRVHISDGPSPRFGATFGLIQKHEEVAYGGPRLPAELLREPGQLSIVEVDCDLR